MRALLLSAGGPNDRAARLAGALVASGVATHLVTATEGSPAPAGVDLIEAAEHPPMIDPGDLAWTLQRNAALFERGAALVMRAPVDIVHAHGWETAHAAAALRRSFDLPLVATIHVVEGELVGQIAWWLATEARRVIVPSAAMRSLVAERFSIPLDRIAVVRADSTARTIDAYRAAVGEHESSRRLLDERKPLRALFERSLASAVDP